MASCKEAEEVLAIGIDLGTTYSCVGVYLKVQGRVQIIPNGQGNRITPSCVAFTETERLIGEGALSQANLNAANTIFDAKRLIGRGWDEKEVQADMKHWPFKVGKTKENRAVFKVEHKGKHKTLSAEEISSMVLCHMRDMAEAYLQSPVKKAVITVPAYFNDSQRKATRDAAVISGLDVLGIINEPTAAAIAYGHDDTKETTRSKMILVFDFGGGTFDVTILEIDGDVLQVRATAGDTHLGGEDIDNNLVEHVMKEFKKKKGIELVEDSKSLRKIKKACEEAKKALSFAEEATVNVEALAGGIDFRTKLTRFKFENLNDSLFERLKGPLNKCLSEAGLEWYDIEEVIMVGGSTRIPKVQGLVKAMFPTKPVSSRLHPDEAVAQGAAVYAAMLTGAVKDLKFTDVTSLSLGIEEKGGRMGVVVHRNTPIPTVMKDTFTISEDNQSCTTYSIYEGEGHMVSQNKLLGQFNLTGLTPSPAGQPRIDVFFHIDAGGILKVSAKDQNSNAYADIVISEDEKGVLSKKVVDRMIEDAQKYRAEDESRRKKERSKIQLEMWLNKIASMLNDPKQVSLVSEVGRKQFENKLEETNEWLEEEGCDLEDYSEYDGKKKVLENLWYKEFECDHVAKD